MDVTNDAKASWWDDYDLPEEWDANFICEGIYLGGLDGALDVKTCREHNITHLVSLLNPLEQEPLDYGLKREEPDIMFVRKTVSLSDNVSEKKILQRNFAEITRFMHNSIKKDGVVLVHCWQGVSRSASIVCAYLMRYEDMTLREALVSIQQRRPQADPNPGFIEMLNDWENTCRKRNKTICSLM